MKKIGFNKADYMDLLKGMNYAVLLASLIVFAEVLINHSDKIFYGFKVALIGGLILSSILLIEFYVAIKTFNFVHKRAMKIVRFIKRK